MSHRYRLYPTPGQAEAMARHCGDARFVWNLALEQFNCYRPALGPTPNGAERSRQLAEARRGSWLGEGSSHVQQQALRQFDQAVKNWWRGSHRRPTWRRRGVNEGFVARDARAVQIGAKWATTTLPKIGPVRFRLSRPVPANHGMGHVTLDAAGRWHISFSAPQSPVERRSCGRGVGVDLGVAATVTTSEGAHHHVPRPVKVERMKRLQRQLSRQEVGSQRRARTKRALAVLHARNRDRRKDWAEKLSTDLVRGYDRIMFEDLRITNMLAGSNRGLNRSISEQGWAILTRRATEKGNASGVEVLRIDPRYTSQQCSVCGYTSRDNRKSQAVFQCRACGHGENADVNAAKVIYARGLRVSARGGPLGAVEARTDTEAKYGHPSEGLTE